MSAIDQNLPMWQFPEPNTLRPRPTTATVTGNTGLHNMTYADQSAASKAGNPIYRDNALATNEAQRAAGAAVTPDIEPQLLANRDVLKQTLGGMPIGVTAQNAGSTFWQGLQGVYDQRLDAQRKVGSVFDALDSSPA